MLRVRVIPVLLLDDESLVKTRRFARPAYIGDPCNTVRIFNELEVDELAFLDITATPQGRGPNFALLKDIAEECFMPLSYGGGLSSFDQAARVFDTGFEKVVLNSHVHTRPALVEEIARVYGSQAVVVGIDVRRDPFGREHVVTHNARKRQAPGAVEWARRVEALGAGEILLTSVEREGSWRGYDLDLVRRVSDAVAIPLIAHGGAGGVEHLARAVREGHASSVAVGSMVVFQKEGYGVLVNFPERETLEAALG
jgi:cyclase